MTRKHVIIIGVVIVILFMIILKLSNNKNNASDTYLVNQAYDSASSKTEYKIYDEKTGRQIANTVDKAAIQLYKDNPDFVGSNEPLEQQENMYDENGKMIEEQLDY